MIPFSDEELIEPVKQTLNSLKPMFDRDGGGIELVGIKEGSVYVKLTGHCKGCAASTQTLKNAVEKTLRINIHPELVAIGVGDDFEL